MYLSRLILNPRSRQVRADVQKPYEIHKTLSHAFPQLTEEQKRLKERGEIPTPFLWRLDTDRRTGRLTVYVQSPREPHWDAVATKHPDYFLDPADAGVDDNPLCRDDLAGKLSHLRQGQSLSFRLRANPSVKKAREGRDQGSRLGLITEEDQLAWIRRKADQGGFRVLSAALVREDGPKDLAKGFKHNGPQEHKLSLLAVRYDGILQVTDPKEFLKAIQNGIGPGKAFGFGLLSVAPA